MEITQFALGVLSVVFLLGIIGGIFGAIQLANLRACLDDQEETIKDLHRDNVQASELNNRRLDDEVNRINEAVGNIYRDMDSRFDKFENRLKTSKQFLKD